MALVIGLHSPVFGYCACEGEVFVGEHLVDSDCHHECDHGHDPVEIPCDEEHEFVTVDPGDFQWTPLMVIDPPLAVVPEISELVVCPILFEEPIVVSSIKLVNPPPPDMPIFRRDAALRL